MTTSQRHYAVGGFAFVALLLATLGLQGSTQPTRASSGESIRAYFHAHAGAIGASEVLIALGFVALLWWAGGVWQHLRTAEQSLPGAANVAVAGLAVGVALVLVDIAIYSTAAVGAARLDASSELLLLDLSTAAVLLGGLGLGMFLAVTCALNRRAHFFPAWTDVLGGLTAVAFVIGAAGIASDNNGIVLMAYAATLGWAVWVLAASVAMWRGERVTPA